MATIPLCARLSIQDSLWLSRPSHPSLFRSPGLGKSCYGYGGSLLTMRSLIIGFHTCGKVHRFCSGRSPPAKTVSRSRDRALMARAAFVAPPQRKRRTYRFICSVFSYHGPRPRCIADFLVSKSSSEKGNAKVQRSDYFAYGKGTSKTF